MSDPKSPIYTIEMRTFAPWNQFGGGYEGDKRGFSLAADSSARIHASTQIDLRTGTASALQVHSDMTRGPEFLVGPAGVGRSQSTGNVEPHLIPDGCLYTLHMEGANPLIPGAPDIDVHAQVTITQPTAGAIKISAELSGDKFPASEMAIRDPSGHPLFIGGFMPPSAAPGPGEFAKLPGDVQRPMSKVELTVTVDAKGNFGQLLSAKLTGPNGVERFQPDRSSTLSTNGFNTTIMQALTPDKMPAPTLPAKDLGLGADKGRGEQLNQREATQPSSPGLER